MTRPGWYRDPWGGSALRFWDGWQWTPYMSALPVTEPPLLDRQIAALKAADPRPWGVRPVALPLLAYVVAILLGAAAGALINPTTRVSQLIFATVVNIALDLIIVAAAVRAGRDIAARADGWGRAFGWCRPRWKDLAIALAGVGIILAGRIALGIVIFAAGAGDRLREAQNLDVKHVDAGVIVLLVVVAVIAAPMLEEFVFRGLLLRTFQQRWSFWPAALLSTLIFALGHTYEVQTLAGAIILALNVAIIGLVHCGLVRYTGRLAPGIMSHAIVNGLAVLVLALGATG